MVKCSIKKCKEPAKFELSAKLITIPDHKSYLANYCEIHYKKYTEYIKGHISWNYFVS